ncbi:1961_t:CDS:2 [Ambispora gerdemannii]|uniref:1961_t:CDS:1 n=1 Tax=Ambispora gerdemannii TaxID=144530 RepID=A0A9N8ZSH8_9GLOM|nr:1961_t:CDS:2 [Ambispora gerdemannii]
MGGTQFSKITHNKKRSLSESRNKHEKSSSSTTLHTKSSSNHSNNLLLETPNSSTNNLLASLTTPQPPTFEEIDRLQQLHYTWRWLWETNYSSPVKKLLQRRHNVRVLDVGCGPGVWTLEMASEYPNVEFYGVDTFESFPTEIKPSNVFFYKASVLVGLPFDSEFFDFIVVRNSNSVFTVQEWSENVFKELTRVLKPSGMIESQESVWNVNTMGPSFQLLANTYNCMLESKNIDLTIAKRIPEFMKNTKCLINVAELKKAHPLSLEEGGKLAESFQQIAHSGFKVLKPQLLPQLRTSAKSYDNLVANIQYEFAHSEVVLYRTFAQKVSSE